MSRAKKIAWLEAVAKECREWVDVRRYGDGFPHYIVREIASYIWNIEAKWGSNWIIADGKPFLFEGVEKKVYPLTLRNPRFAAFLAYRYGLAAPEKITREVEAILKSYTFNRGVTRTLRRFSYCDPDTKTTYLSQYDGTCLRLDGHSVQRVDNGAGALFIDDDGGVPPDLDVVNDVKPHGLLLPMLLDGMQLKDPTEAGTTAAEQKRLFLYWIFSLAFPDAIPTKAILILEGQKGSGKTVAVQILQEILVGQRKGMSVRKADEKDFGVNLLKQMPIALLDNVDTMIPWLQDAVCAYVTGVGWRQRVLYSDDDVIEINPQTFIAVPSKNPITFRRDDIADRSIVLRLESREGRYGYTDSNAIFDRVRTLRTKLYGEWIYYVNQIVGLWRSGAYHRPQIYAHRMADYARMAYLIGAALGHSTEDIEGALLSAQNERDVLTAEQDTLRDIIHRWSYDTRLGDEVDAGALYTSLKNAAARYTVDFYPKSPSHLIKRLDALAPALRAEGLIIRRRSVPGNKEVYYRFGRVDPKEGDSLKDTPVKGSA